MLHWRGGMTQASHHVLIKPKQAQHNPNSARPAGPAPPAPPHLDLTNAARIYECNQLTNSWSEWSGWREGPGRGDLYCCASITRCN